MAAIRLEVESPKKIVSGIYKWTNNKNGKVYIGKAEHLLKRRKRHLTLYKMYNKNKVELEESKTNKRLYNAMIEDGVMNFKFEIIERCENADLDLREDYWICEYNSIEDGYNMIEAQNTFE